MPLRAPDGVPKERRDISVFNNGIKGILDYMMQKIMSTIFGNAITNIFMIIGVALFCLTIYFDINPAESSIVDPLVRGTWIHIFIFITTIPALTVMLVGGDGIVGFALMVFSQICVFWILGRISSLLFAAIIQQKKKNKG